MRLRDITQCSELLKKKIVKLEYCKLMQYTDYCTDKTKVLPT